MEMPDTAPQVQGEDFGQQATQNGADSSNDPNGRDSCRERVEMNGHGPLRSTTGQPANGDSHERGSTVSDDVNCVNVDEASLVPETGPTGGSAEWRDLITDLSGLEEVRELGSSRLGVVRLFRRPKEASDEEAGDGFEYFAAKFYKAGDNREGFEVFKERMNKFISLSHPRVMRIVGIIPPTKVTGPIIITPYSRSGSLEDVLTLVRQNNLPSFWNDATKLRMIVDFVSGLNYLHQNEIVHGELKPTDLIIAENGSLLISDYVTSILEEYNYTRAPQVGPSSYLAPELYCPVTDGTRIDDPKSDVFSFGSILYELLTHQRVCPSAMSPAMIMRRAMRTTPNDRPNIPSSVHPFLRYLITRCRNPAPAKRPTMDALWKSMRDVGFSLFPNVTVTTGPTCTSTGNLANATTDEPGRATSTNGSHKIALN
jgi:serine/threonine protein kinase